MTINQLLFSPSAVSVPLFVSFEYKDKSIGGYESARTPCASLVCSASVGSRDTNTEKSALTELGWGNCDRDASQSDDESRVASPLA